MASSISGLQWSGILYVSAEEGCGMLGNAVREVEGEGDRWTTAHAGVDCVCRSL